MSGDAPAPMAGHLRLLADGESLRGRPLRVREVADAAGLIGRHALFAGEHADADRRLLRAGLRIEAQRLRLARVVHGGPGS